MMDLSQLAVDPTDYDPLRMLVRFQDEAAVESTIGGMAGATIGQEYSLVDGLFEINLEAGIDFAAILAAFQDNKSVLYAQPDYRVQVSLTPNDPSFDDLWGLHNTGQNGGTADADIDAPEAWDEFSPPTGDSVVVAIIDTGVDYTHPDLINRMWVNPGEIAGNGIDDDGNGYVDDVHGVDFVNNDGDPKDDHFHGTHVAGTIAADFNNGVGVTGVAGNANVEIMALKFLASDGGGYTSDAVSALQYAVANGATISNNSWGGGGYSQALFDAISDAGNAGHLFIAAAGNESSDNDNAGSFPANYDLDNVVSVAATNRNDGLAGFSNYGNETVDLGAPGVNIFSTFPTYMTPAMQSGGFSTDYETISGTSMATPHVSGVVALMSAHNPGWTSRQITTKLYASLDPIPSLANTTITGGRLNAAATLGPDLSGPQVYRSTPRAMVGGSVSQIQLIFNEPIDAASFTIADDIVSFTGPEGVDLMDQITGMTGSGDTYTITIASQSTKGDYALVLGPNITDLAETPNVMDQDGDGIQGEIPDDQYTVAFTLADQLTFVSDDVPAPIYDMGIVASYLTIDSDITIKDLNVHIDITHTWDGDLEVYLVQPGEDPMLNPFALIPLIIQQGGGGQNFTGTILDDEASMPIGSGSAPFTGRFRPDTPLSQFDGISTLGQWQLWVFDSLYGDEGTLDGWALEVLPEGSDPPPTNQPPTAEAGGPYSGSMDTTIVLDAAGSSDSDGTIAQYDWDLDNDGQYDVSGQTADFLVSAAGSYTVGLRVTDDDGGTDTDTAQVTVTEPVVASGPALQHGVAESGSGWTTVTLDDAHTYESMVVATTPNYGAGQGPAVVRVRNAAGSSFEFQVVTPDGPTVSGVDVHYMVVEEGSYNEAEHGVKMEAVTLTSATTDRSGSWAGEQQTYLNSYTDPVVFGQVMTANDPNWSVFWSHGISRSAPASASVLYVGKHVGQDDTVLGQSEEIGYIVIEAGAGDIGTASYEAGLGSDIVRGVENVPPYAYSHGLASATTAILTQAAMDDRDGSWAILYGADPLGQGAIHLAVDEDQIADSERNHSTEQVSFIVFQEYVPPNVPPNAIIVGDSQGNEGSSLAFDGSGSSDLDGTLTNYQWDFGDGATATGLNPTHTYMDNGSYTVTLTVNDDQGATGATTATVAVANVAPMVEAGSDITIDKGESVDFVGAFADPGLDSYTFEWDFGDGSTSDRLSPSHVFTGGGFYTVELTVTDDDGGVGTDTLVVTVENPYLDLRDHLIESYAGGQDARGTATIEDYGATLHLVGNVWKAIDLAYTVTPDTILAFDFSSVSQGEVHAIGFDDDLTVTWNRGFQLYGTDRGFTHNDFNDYGTVAPGVNHYELPVGHFFTGEMSYLFFANDHDVAPSSGESIYSNIRVYEDVATSDHVSLYAHTISSYAGGQDAGGAAEIEDGGAALHLVGNTWKAIDLAYTVTSDTILAFDFQSTSQGELHAIGFDNDLVLSGDRAFQLYGTDRWGLGDFNDYATAAPGVRHYEIPVGQFFTGEMSYLFFTNDHDAGLSTGEGIYSNLRVYEGVSTPDQISLYGHTIDSYAGGQDAGGTAVIEEDGAALHLVGNTWKAIDLAYTVTTDTILSFDFQSTSQGELHAIGLDDDLVLSGDRAFQLYGTDRWGLGDFNDYATAAPDVRHYEIPVGQFFTGEMAYLFFTNDHDIAVPTGESLYSNIRIHEGGAASATATADAFLYATTMLGGSSSQADILPTEEVEVFDTSSPPVMTNDWALASSNDAARIAHEIAETDLDRDPSSSDEKKAIDALMALEDWEM